MDQAHLHASTRLCSCLSTHRQLKIPAMTSSGETLLLEHASELQRPDAAASGSGLDLPFLVQCSMSRHSALLAQLFPMGYGARSWVSFMQYALSISYLLPLFVARFYLESFSVLCYDLLVESSGDKCFCCLHTKKMKYNSKQRHIQWLTF